MFQKGFSQAIVLSILLVVFLLAAGAYYLGVRRNIVVNPVDVNKSAESVVASQSPSSSILPQILPQASDSIKVAESVSTKGWKSVNYPNISFRVPQQTIVKEGVCHEDFEKCYLISGHDDTLLSPPFITLYTKAYKGGSRRQEANLTGENTITETSFGKNQGLVEVNICKIDNCTKLRKIIFVVNNQLIVITDGMYKLPKPLPNGDTATLESLVTNTIVTTFQ
ncbi:hypothetical protein HYU94_03695 [Candidatus Daviesbacteria bacterium]|nr:hypothetical protein [Candidatus Daviesbacteria bacterium]